MVHSICLRFAENLAFSRIAPKNQMSVLFRVSKIFAAARMHRCQLLKCGRNATRKHKIFLPCIRNICKQKMTLETISRGKMLFGRKDYIHMRFRLSVLMMDHWIYNAIQQFSLAQASRVISHYSRAPAAREAAKWSPIAIQESKGNP